MLHYYLAAVGPLRDHTRRLWRKYLPDDAEYAERARAAFADSGLCVFVQNVRNFALDTNLPITRGHMSWEGQGSPLKTGVELNSTDPLRWKNWPAPAKRYLAELSDDGIDLQEVVAS